MNITDFLQRFDNPQETSNGWQVCCPAHEDAKPSLSIAEGKDGRILLDCKAGCDFNKIIASLGLTTSDMSPPKTYTGKPRIEETYNYTDTAGALIFQVCRFEPKDFRQRRPDGKGGWFWNMHGIKRVLYRLPDVIEAKRQGELIAIVEGEKDADAISRLGLCGTCNPLGATIRDRNGMPNKWLPLHTETLTGADIVIFPDKDNAGREHSKIVHAELQGKANSLKVVELPDRNGHKVKDVSDWIHAGGTLEELKKLITETGQGKPQVILPNGEQTISETARQLGELLAKTERFFNRGGVLMRLTKEIDLDPIKTAALPSIFEDVAEIVTAKKTNKGTVFCRALCTEQQAKLILNSRAFIETLPPIHILARCPVLIERAGRLVQVAGYDRESGILAAGEPAKVVELEEAKRLLKDILSGFRFATPADNTRSLAALITPALIFGGLLKGRAPVDLGEADSSQAGKGYRNRLTAALYMQTPKTITQKKSGVGSMEETFNMTLIRGANFITIDNVRGKIDSPAIESFLTEDNYQARAPYIQPVDIDPRRVVVQMTSNKAELTTDFANRCSCCRILKQPETFPFKNYHEGDVLNHVRVNQSLYLGAVFAIVKAWHEIGMPKSNEKRHDFRVWAQNLDWICQHILEAGSLLDGLKETQERMANPVLNWLRDICLEVERNNLLEQVLKASDLVELIAVNPDIETPGLQEHGDITDEVNRSKVFQATGRRLSLCFRTENQVSIDGYLIERKETHNANGDVLKGYTFTKPNKSLCSANDPSIKPQYPSNQTNTPIHFVQTESPNQNDIESKKSMEPIDGLDGYSQNNLPEEGEIP